MRTMIAALMALLLAACGQDGGTATAEGKAAADDGAPVGKPVLVLALGDSLFAGYRLSRAEAYPAQLELALRERGLNVRVQNAGVSGDTTAAGRQRLDFVLDSMTVKPDVALVEFGGNDLLRGLPPAQARANLDAMLEAFAARDIPVVLYAMQAPPNLGGDYVRAFNAIYPELADKHDAELVPLFIQPLLTDRSLVLDDQIHPNAQGVRAMVAATVDQVADVLD